MATTPAQAASVRRRRAGNIRLLQAYLSAHPCVDCGEADPEMLDFDHVTGTKRAAVSDLAQRAYAWTAIFQEIRKCQVRCVRCHRRRTNRERKRAQQERGPR